MIRKTFFLSFFLVIIIFGHSFDINSMIDFQVESTIDLKQRDIIGIIIERKENHVDN